MKHILFIAACIAGSVSLYAQTTVHGRVTDALTGAPLPGASISFSGKGGTNSDKDGNFTFPCGKTSRITVSYQGYESAQEAVLNCNDEMLISLNPVSRSLNLVEITAVTTQNKAMIYQPVSITKLSSVELKRSTGLFLDDAINTNVPGVFMQRRSVSGGQQFNIRGYGNGTRGTAGISSNFDNQGSKVYLNGIPVTDAEGITVMDDIDFGTIGNVEVIKGPSGTLYGLAIAGVVNLNTIRPEKGKTSISQEAMFGSYGLRRYNTRFAVGGDRTSLLVSYGKQKYDGFYVHTASHKDFINLAGEFRPNEKQTVNAYFGYSNSYDERAGELTIGQYDTMNYAGNASYIRNNAHSEVIGFRAGVGHTYKFSKAVSNTTTVFGSGLTNNSSSAAGWTDKDPINYGLRSTLDTRFNFSGGTGLSGITGVETQQQRAQTIGYAMVDDANDPGGYRRIGAMRSNQSTLTGNTSFFTEWTLSFPQDLSITGGIGLSRMHIELNDRFFTNNTAPNHFERTYDDMLAPHVAVNKVFNKHVSAYASYSKGFRAPASSYFFIPSTGEVNTSLKPEKGRQFEIGSKGSLLNDRLSYQLSVFDARFSDKMTAVAVSGSSGTLYSYAVNGGSQDDRGIEALVKYTAYQSGKGFLRSISPFANFTYSDFNYTDFSFQKVSGGNIVTEDYSGHDVAGVAPITFNAGIDVFTHPGLYAQATYSYRDKTPINSINTEYAKSFSLLNAKLGFRHSIGYHFDLDAYAGVNNITGAQYYFMIFANQLPDAYLPAPYKANYFGGLNLSYNF